MTAAQVSLDELIRAGITPNPDTAVAIARALIRERSSSTTPLSSHEAPLPENIYLADDGTIVCRDGATPTVSEVAIFLRRLLPVGSAGIPGGLHYAIARALLEVDAPPFESAEDFSCALARYERGDQTQIVRGLVERAQTSVRATARPATERRRTTSTSYSDLRRAVQEADIRLFEQQTALAAMAATRPPQTWNRFAVAACISAAAAGGGAGYLAHSRLAMLAPGMTNASVNAAGPTAVSAVQPRDIILTAPLPRSGEAGTRPLSKSVTGTSPRVPGKSTVRRTTQAGSPNDPSLLKRLRLQWLRKAFTWRT